MTIDERLEAVTMNLELLSRDREHDKQRIDALLAALGNDKQRIDALLIAVEKDAENIRALARVAEIHAPRLTDLEG